MKIKKDDNVIVLTGKDKGKSGKVIQSFPRLDKVIIDGVNIRKRHRRATREGQKGQIVEMPFPIHVSNIRKTDSEPTKKPAAKSKKKTAASK